MTVNPSGGAKSCSAKFITMFTRARPIPILNHTNLVQIFSSHFLKIYFTIILTFWPLSHNARLAFPFLLGTSKLSFAYFRLLRAAKSLFGRYLGHLFVSYGRERCSQITFIMWILLWNNMPVPRTMRPKYSAYISTDFPVQSSYSLKPSIKISALKNALGMCYPPLLHLW